MQDHYHNPGIQPELYDFGRRICFSVSVYLRPSTVESNAGITVNINLNPIINFMRFLDYTKLILSFAL